MNENIAERKFHFWRSSFFILLPVSISLAGILFGIRQVDRRMEILTLEDGYTVSIVVDTATVVVVGKTIYGEPVVYQNGRILK